MRKKEKAIEEIKEKEIEEKAEELRRLLKNPDIMHEVMKDAYIPVGRSAADMIDDVLQNAQIFEDQQGGS